MWSSLLYASLGLLARLCLVSEAHSELSTPLNAHNRLVEGVALFNLHNGSLASVYEGVVVHHTPLFTLFMVQVPFYWHKFVFAVVDVVTAFVVAKCSFLAVEALRRREQKQKHIWHEEAADLLVASDASSLAFDRSFLLYLFHPYLIGSSSALTSTVFDNLFLSGFFCFALSRHRLLAALCLALAAYQSLYPVCLLSSLVLFMMEDDSTGDKEEGKKKIVKKDKIVKENSSNFKEYMQEILCSSFCFLCLVSMLLYASYFVCGGSFLSSVYGFVLSAPELTPNIGLFWYFFTEMFDHFRLFFVATFQLNIFIYIVPLTIRFKEDPFCLGYILLSLMAIFKSYPCYGDVGLYLAFLPALTHLLPWTNNTFITFNAMLAATALMPVASSLWLYNGSANANYLFALNLVFASAQIFLVTGIASAFLRRQFFMKNGYKALKSKDATVSLVLQ